MFIPKQIKFKKLQKGSRINKISKILSLENLKCQKVLLIATNFGNINSKQIESVRQTINKLIKKKGLFKIMIFPHIPVTKKPIEVRMGKGKGNVNKWISKVKSGTLICEIQCNDEKIAFKALTFAQYKLPVKTKIITK